MFNKARKVAGRRNFLRLTAAVSGALASLGLVKGAPAEREEQDVHPATPQAKAGYRETAHIREYYEKARF